MNPAIAAFVLVGGVALIAAWAMVAARNMVYSALFMVVVLMSTAVLYLLYQAPLIALVQVTIYAGGIMVLVLFVIMLIGADSMMHTETLRWQRPLAFGLGAVLAVETLSVIRSGALSPAMTSLGSSFGSPSAIGVLLFRDYVLPFEVVSVILLVAVVGAVVLTVRRERRR